MFGMGDMLMSSSTFKQRIARIKSSFLLSLAVAGFVLLVFSAILLPLLGANLLAGLLGVVAVTWILNGILGFFAYQAIKGYF